MTGHVSELVDQKMLKKCNVAIAKWARARRKWSSLANVHYLRLGRCFVLIATRGRHLFFEEHSDFKDVRRDPIKFAGYSISYKLGVDHEWHPSVRIHPDAYRKLKARLLSLASFRSAEDLSAEFRKIPFEPYAPARRQLIYILRAVNRERQAAGFEGAHYSALRLSRRGVKVFTEVVKKAA